MADDMTKNDVQEQYEYEPNAKKLATDASDKSNEPNGQNHESVTSNGDYNTANTAMPDTEAPENAVDSSIDFTNDDANANNFYTNVKSTTDEQGQDEYKPDGEEANCNSDVAHEATEEHGDENGDENGNDNANGDQHDHHNGDENGIENGNENGNGDQHSQDGSYSNYTNDNSQNCHDNSRNQQQHYQNQCNNNNNYNQQDFEPEQLRKVFVGSLNYNTSEDTFRAHFSKYGKLVDCVIMKEPKTNKSRGFGFVTYTKSTMVDEMMRNRPHKLDGRELDTKRATPREESGKPGAEATTEKLFVGAIKEGLTEDQMREYFSAYGNIQDCVIIRDKETQKSRGFGFVTFDDYDPVDKIVLEKFHTIQGQSVAVKKALPKEQNNQNNMGNNNNNNFGGYGGNNMNRNNYNNNNNYNNPNPFQMQPNNNFQPNRFNNNDFNSNFNSFTNGSNFGNGMMPNNGNFGNNQMQGRRNMGGAGGPMRNHNNGPRRNNGPYGGLPNRMQQRQNQ